jgi:ApaG protein
MGCYDDRVSDSGPMSDSIPVKVIPVPQYLGEHEEQHAFAYTIHITNEGDEPIILKNRHWIITHGDGNVEEVIGEGVVGETPELPPGARYSYTSGAFIPTRVGSMKGSYGFVTRDGRVFRVEIPEFALLAPDSLH